MLSDKSGTCEQLIWKDKAGYIPLEVVVRVLMKVSSF